VTRARDGERAVEQPREGRQMLARRVDLGLSLRVDGSARSLVGHSR
jgi:hypothetical protein